MEAQILQEGPGHDGRGVHYYFVTWFLDLCVLLIVGAEHNIA